LVRPPRIGEPNTDAQLSELNLDPLKDTVADSDKLVLKTFTNATIPDKSQ
jgi:hypothetical protein